LVAAAKLDDPEPRGYVHALLRTWLGKGGPRSPEDHVAPGRELLYFYEHTEEEIFLDAAYRLAYLHGSFPANKHGARMHRPDQQGWRKHIWVDCMDVEAPFLANLADVTGEDRFFRQAAQELLGYTHALQDESTGLFHHGFEEGCGRNGQVWARGNGWALEGLVNTLAVLPSENPSFAELQQRLVALCEGLERHQHESGLWHTVIPGADTYLESTLAAMTAHALHGAFLRKLVDRDRFGGMEGRARAAV
ncbi:MAG: hypothetical protein GY953_11635, partial [bacterium]|nr:hypothetical protein [bacterium]